MTKEEMYKELDFMLGSIEECNFEPLKSILKEDGIDPAGGWIDAEKLPKETLESIANKLFGGI